jgi:hypothetical protein
MNPMGADVPGRGNTRKTTGGRENPAGPEGGGGEETPEPPTIGRGGTVASKGTSAPTSASGSIATPPRIGGKDGTATTGAIIASAPPRRRKGRRVDG